LTSGCESGGFRNVKLLLFSLLVAGAVSGCSTAANLRSQYQPVKQDGPWTQELKTYDHDHPDWRPEPIFGTRNPAQ